MDSTTLLTMIGLIFNIIGTVSATVFGFPQPSFDTEEKLLMDNNSEEKKNEDAKIRRREVRHVSLSYVALTLIIIGFILQFVGLLA